MTENQKVKEITDKMYAKYGADSDYLFCIPRTSIEEIVKFVLEKVEK